MISILKQFNFYSSTLPLQKSKLVFARSLLAFSAKSFVRQIRLTNKQLNYYRDAIYTRGLYEVALDMSSK